MTRAIWRYPLAAGNEIAMPKGAEVLSVGTKDGETVELWAVVDPELGETEVRRFAVLMTGQEWTDDGTIMQHLGTVVLEGEIVAHVFEGIRPGADWEMAR